MRGGSRGAEVLATHGALTYLLSIWFWDGKTAGTSISFSARVIKYWAKQLDKDTDTIYDSL